jgi:hypothetical protein
VAAAVLVGFQAMAAGETVSSSDPVVTSGGGRSLSVLSGQTVGRGNTVFFGELGFPGLSGEILYGANPTFDLGGKFTFNYGVEGLTDYIHPELKLNVVGRVSLLKKAKFNLGLKFEPGFLMLIDNGAHFGLALPLGLQVGIRASSALQAVLAFDVPVAIFIGDGGTSALIPILFGAGVEYQLDRDTLLTFHIGLGPGISTDGGSSFVLQSLFGIALPI